MALLNQHFAPSAFSFTLIENIQVVDPDLATCGFSDRDQHARIGSAYREGDITTLNVFFCDIPEEGRAGLAYYPYEVPLNMDTDAVYIDPEFFGIGQPTLSHETGHWFGLQVSLGVCRRVSQVQE